MFTSNHVLCLDFLITFSTDKLKGCTIIVTVEYTRLARFDPHALTFWAPSIGIGIGWIVGVAKDAQARAVQKMLAHKCFPVVAMSRTMNRSLCYV